MKKDLTKLKLFTTLIALTFLVITGGVIISDALAGSGNEREIKMVEKWIDNEQQAHHLLQEEKNNLIITHNAKIAEIEAKQLEHHRKATTLRSYLDLLGKN